MRSKIKGMESLKHTLIITLVHAKRGQNLKLPPIIKSLNTTGVAKGVCLEQLHQPVEKTYPF